MQTQLEIETERPEEIRQIIGLSLESTDTVNYDLNTENNKIKIKIRTDGLGPLRGCTDTVFRLTSLAEKLY